MNNGGKVRWAILGAGKIAHKFAQDFKKVHNAKLVAVAARSADRASAFAEKFGIPHALSYPELYSSSLVDVVYIATTHNFHFEQSLACLENSKGVLCEKPITINDTELKKLAALSSEKQVFLMEALWTYFLPAIQKVKGWVDSGSIGAIKTIHADFCFPMEYDPSSRLYDPLLAGGSLLDLGIYPIAFATYFMDRKPDVIKATAIMSNTHVDASTAMIFQYGAVSAFLGSSMVSKSLNKALIIGESGYIEVPDFFKAFTARLYNEDGQLVESFDDKRSTWGYEFEAQEVTDCILQGKWESKVVPHHRSNELQEILTEVRRQIGVTYPMEQVPG